MLNLCRQKNMDHIKGAHIIKQLAFPMGNDCYDHFQPQNDHSS